VCVCACEPMCLGVRVRVACAHVRPFFSLVHEHDVRVKLCGCKDSRVRARTCAAERERKKEGPSDIESEKDCEKEC